MNRKLLIIFQTIDIMTRRFWTIGAVQAINHRNTSDKIQSLHRPPALGNCYLNLSGNFYVNYLCKNILPLQAIICKLSTDILNSVSLVNTIFYVLFIISRFLSEGHSRLKRCYQNIFDMVFLKFWHLNRLICILELDQNLK